MPPSRLPAVAALLLVAADVAAALIAWSRVALGLPPSWEAARAMTLAGYGAAAAVGVWAALRRR